MTSRRKVPSKQMGAPQPGPGDNNGARHFFRPPTGPSRAGRLPWPMAPLWPIASGPGPGPALGPRRRAMEQVKRAPATPTHWIRRLARSLSIQIAQQQPAARRQHFQFRSKPQGARSGLASRSLGRHIRPVVGPRRGSPERPEALELGIGRVQPVARRVRRPTS